MLNKSLLQVIQTVNPSNVCLWFVLSGHWFLYDCCYFLGGLIQNFIHILGHGMIRTKVFMCWLSCFSIWVQGCLILF